MNREESRRKQFGRAHMVRLYVAHDSGAECLSVGGDGRDREGSGLNSSQICALLSSFALFEEKQSLRTLATSSETNLCVQFGQRNRRSGLQPFGVLSQRTHEAEDREGFIQLVEKCLDMVASPPAILAGGGPAAHRMPSKEVSSDLRRVLGRLVARHGEAAEPRLDRKKALEAPLAFGDLLGALTEFSGKVSNALAYCATAWIQEDDFPPLVWTDESALIPEGTNNRLTVDSCVAIAGASSHANAAGDGGGDGRYAHTRVYLGDEFLSSDVAEEEAALCSLHVFCGGTLRLAMVCEGVDAFDLERNANLVGMAENILTSAVALYVD